MPTSFLYFAKIEKDFMPKSLPPESVLFNVSFHTKTSNRMNNIESEEGGFKKTLTQIFAQRIPNVPTYFAT